MNLLAIGEGKNHDSAIILYEDEENHMMKVGLPFTNYYLSANTDNAIDWLYNGRLPYDIENINSAILTATNVNQLIFGTVTLK